MRGDVEMTKAKEALDYFVKYIDPTDWPAGYMEQAIRALRILDKIESGDVDKPDPFLDYDNYGDGIKEGYNQCLDDLRAIE